MDYDTIRCGMKVLTPSGQVGTVTEYEGTMQFSFDRGLQNRSKHNLKATVKVGDEEMLILIRRLREVQ